MLLAFAFALAFSLAAAWASAFTFAWANAKAFCVELDLPAAFGAPAVLAVDFGLREPAEDLEDVREAAFAEPVLALLAFVVTFDGFEVLRDMAFGFVVCVVVAFGLVVFFLAAVFFADAEGAFAFVDAFVVAAFDVFFVGAGFAATLLRFAGELPDLVLGFGLCTEFAPLLNFFAPTSGIRPGR